jgi:crotonobetainyl-CoA:carnitine CoA-transferase CaiB-like acyl-CoA transferase
VLELADESGVYCGKLLADLGADVIKIEPPGGDATRRIPPFRDDREDADGSLFFLYMNTSKRGITLDLATPAGRELLERLAATADLIVETLPPGFLDECGLGYERLRALRPGIVLTSITGFGGTGPYRRLRSSDLVASALGGAMYVTGHETDPPVRLAGEQAHVVASVCAAASSMIALYHSARSREGQHVDISVEEVVAASAHVCGAGKWLDDGIIPTRGGTGLFASVPSGAYPCRDGFVYLMVNRPLHWKALAEWVHEVTGNTAVLDPHYQGPSSNRFHDRDLLDVYICELTSSLTVDEVYREGQRRHIALTPVNSATAVVADPHLAARGYFVDVEHPGSGTVRYPGAPYRPAPLAGGPASARRRRCDLMGQALDGLRVIEFTAGMAGPWIGRFMAYSGAEVIRVESRKRPDVNRLYVSPKEPERGTQPQSSPWLTDWDAGKRFVALDLTRPEAVELATRLVGTADVVIENYTAGVMDKLGLGYEVLRAASPDLVMLSTSGYGDSGPCRDHVTWGPNIEAMAGLSTLSGFPESACTITQYAYPDSLCALHGLVAVMAALDHRLRTGEGQYVNLSQLEATIASIGHVMMESLANDREPPRRGNRSPWAAPHGCYPCRGDDRWCAIAVYDEAEWERFCDLAGHPEWLRDARFATLKARLHNADALDELVGEWTAPQEDYDVMARLQTAGIAAGVVQNVADQVERDRQLAARGFFEEIEHLKKGTVVATGIPLGLTGTPGRTGRAGAAVGQDNDYVFGTLLGLTPGEIQAYADAGAIEPLEH